MDVKIVDATPDDSEFVAKCVVAAVQLYDFENDCAYLKQTVELVLSEKTVFSYRNARIAKVGDELAGCMISYPGTIYQEAIRHTMYEKIYKNSDLECAEDEYYLDSAAVIPKFRGANVAKMLFADAIQKGTGMGFKKISLIVLDKPDHDNLKRYYMSTFGFAESEEKVTLFGSRYNKIIKDKNYRHIVLWKFKGSEEERMESAKWMKRNLEKLYGQIPGLLYIKVLTGQVNEQQYDALLDSSFISPFYLDLYKNHPLHLAISQNCRKLRESRVAFDSWETL